MIVKAKTDCEVQMKYIVPIVLLFIVGCNESQLTDEKKCENLVLLKTGTEAYATWVAEYGDSPESWQLFTIKLHTKYMIELHNKIQVLQTRLDAYPDPNEIIKISEKDRSEAVAALHAATNTIYQSPPDPTWEPLIDPFNLTNVEQGLIRDILRKGN
jgi:hypothetical protein